jgi:hypothetical protein
MAFAPPVQASAKARLIPIRLPTGSHHPGYRLLAPPAIGTEFVRGERLFLAIGPSNCLSGHSAKLLQIHLAGSIV